MLILLFQAYLCIKQAKDDTKTPLNVDSNMDMSNGVIPPESHFTTVIANKKHMLHNPDDASTEVIDIEKHLDDNNYIVFGTKNIQETIDEKHNDTKVFTNTCKYEECSHTEDNDYTEVNKTNEQKKTAKEKNDSKNDKKFNYKGMIFDIYKNTVYNIYKKYLEQNIEPVRFLYCYIKKESNTAKLDFKSICKGFLMALTKSYEIVFTALTWINLDKETSERQAMLLASDSETHIVNELLALTIPVTEKIRKRFLIFKPVSNESIDLPTINNNYNDQEHKRSNPNTLRSTNILSEHLNKTTSLIHEIDCFYAECNDKMETDCNMQHVCHIQDKIYFLFLDYAVYFDHFVSQLNSHINGQDDKNNLTSFIFCGYLYNLLMNYTSTCEKLNIHIDNEKHNLEILKAVYHAFDGFSFDLTVWTKKVKICCTDWKESDHVKINNWLDKLSNIMRWFTSELKDLMVSIDVGQ